MDRKFNAMKINSANEIVKRIFLIVQHFYSAFSHCIKLKLKIKE